MNKKDRPISKCCEALAKVNMVREEGETRFMFCTKCLQPCDTKAKEGFSNRSTQSTKRKTTGEMEMFIQEVWPRCKGLSEISKEPLHPPGHPLFASQFSHDMPKGTYQGERLNAANITACTVEEHEAWPFVKEKTDEELKALGEEKWIPRVTAFRARRLRANLDLKASLSGNKTSY